MAGAGDQKQPQPDELTEITIPEAPRPAGNETVGGLLGERYRVLARLGAGAFGEVYRAHDSDLGRDVAVKRIRLEAFVEASQLQDVQQRFQREAQVAARLRHPNIVTTHDIIKAPVTFIVMELVEGQTLQALLQQRGRLPLDETTQLMAQAAAALDHAHANQVVHRDVKPANIMIEPGGHVKVMDFGIAKLETGANLTTTGSIMGTPNYMSPEQAKGLKVDGRSDLFSLGCVLYECLTGVKPFQGASVSVILVKILTEEPPAVDFAATGLPLEIGAVLKRALAKDPAARYPTGALLIEALRTAGQTTLVAAPTAGRIVAPPPLPPPASPAAAAVVDPSAARAPRSGGRLGLGLLAAVLLVAALLATGSLAGLGGETRVAGEGGGLVLEETPGLVGRVMGRQPRLRVTVPAGTRLRLAVEAPLSSETARAGDGFSAESTSPVRVEGVEAVPSGVRFSGSVSEAAPARDSEGRGRMTLVLESVQLPDGSRVSVSTRPLVLRAPSTKKKDAGIVGGLAAAGAVVGGLIGGKGGAVGGAVVGGAAGVAVVTTDGGREVALAARASLSVEVAEPFSVTRSKEP